MYLSKLYCTAILLVTIPGHHVAAQEGEFSVFIGGCSISLNDGWELGVRNEEYTVFTHLPDVSGTNSEALGSKLIYSDYEEEVYTNGGEILEHSQLNEIHILRLLIEPPEEISISGEIEYAYLHDEKNSLKILGPIAQSFWNASALRARVTGDSLVIGDCLSNELP